ncbi:hypothetical protein C8J56DRAFT_1168090 [Mycena floridula]|nr:hypothetical protein C8J56DRAFT_1168090 [Mycena floridula]
MARGLPDPVFVREDQADPNHSVFIMNRSGTDEPDSSRKYGRLSRRRHSRKDERKDQYLSLLDFSDNRRSTNSEGYDPHRAALQKSHCRLFFSVGATTVVRHRSNVLKTPFGRFLSPWL